jgi:hypothetical protein
MVLDDPNKNFRFDGVGSVMSEINPYGGLIYGHNNETIALWVPNIHEGTNAAMFMLGKLWGSGYKTQMTNDVNIIISGHDVFGMDIYLLSR